MAKSTNYRGIHISVIYEYGYDYYEIREINKGKKWNDATLFSTLKEAKQYIDDHYDELVKLCNVKESKSYARKSMKEGLIDIRKQIQDYADANEFDITVQTTPKNELIIVFGGTSDTDKIYNALMKELKSKCVNLSKVDVKKKNDIVIVTWDLNFSNKGMFDEIIVEDTINLIDNLSEVVNLHYVF